MNTSRSFRGKRKKAIPLYFQKRNSSLQDILQTAAYKRRIKELLKNNKQLAVTLQDAKYKAANQQSKIEEYARTTTQVVHARMKLREMVSNLQKLVTDVDEVATLLDVGTFNILKNANSSDVRMRIALPETSTIEESASRSTLEADITSAEESTENSSLADQHTCSPVKKDTFVLGNLRSSLARVDSMLKGNLDNSQEILNDENRAEVCNASISVESPETPQLEIIRPKKTGKLHAFLQNYQESPRKPLQTLNTLLVGKSLTNTFVSKIPKVLPTQHIETQDENVLPTSNLPNKASNRRDTFVVPKQCNEPTVFPSAADRRGTFTINVLNEKVQNVRRETYLVPPIPEVPILTSNLNVSDPPSATNLTVPDPPSANEFPNKTILLSEDMELTEIIPTQIWIEKTVEGVPTLKNKTPVTLPAIVADDTEFAKAVPILKTPQPVIENDNPSNATKAAPNKKLPNAPAVRKPGDEACFPKPLESKTSPLHSTSKKTPIVEQKQSLALDDNTKDDEIVHCRRSKKVSDIEPTVSSAKETKSRSSSLAKRKSIVHKKSGRLSNAKSKGSHSKSDAVISSTESLSTKPSEVNFLSDIDDSLPLDMALSPSPSSDQRSNKNETQVRYEKYFENVFEEPNKDKFVPGRKVLNFFETRKSLVPNKRVFVFTNSSKKAVSESEVPVSKTGMTSDKKRNDAFEFSASDSDSPSISKKHKKERKKTKRSHSAVTDKKESANKKPRSEKVQQHVSEKVGEEPCSEKSDSCLKKLSSSSESVKLNLKPVSLETSPDDSFVIGMNNNDRSKLKQLVNLKGDQVFSDFSNEVRKTPLRQCKKFLTEIRRGESVLPKKDAAAVQSAVNDVYDPSSLDKNEVYAELDSGNRDVQRRSSSRSSKLSGEKGKAKRPFSGISERRSKKKSTLDPSDFFEELHGDAFSQEDLPKTADLNNEVSSLDLGMTQVYDCKERVDTKVQKRNLDNQKHVSEVRKKVGEDDNLKKVVESERTAKEKSIDEEAHHSPFEDVTEVYNLKDLIHTKVQKRKLVNLKQVSENKQVQQNDNLKEKLKVPQTIKAKDTLSDGEDHSLSMGEVTEVYNLKDLIRNKSPKRNLDSTKHKMQAQHNENVKKSSEPLQTRNVKDMPSEEEILQTYLSEKTEVYNFKNLMGAKVQKRNPEESKQVSEEKRRAQHVENRKKGSELLQTQNAQNKFTEEETLQTSLGEKTEVYNIKNLMGAKVQKRNPEESKQVSGTKKVRPDENCFKKSNHPPQIEKDVFSDTETLPPTVTKNKKVVKDSKREVELSREECVDDLTKAAFSKTDTTVSSLGKTKKLFKDCSQDLVVKKLKHAETVVKKSSQDIIPEDVLCSAETIDPILSKKKNEGTLKDSNRNENKHRDKSHKKLVPTQSTKNKIPLDGSSSNNIKNTFSVFDKAELEKIPLDNLSNNDFIPSKSSKDAPKKKMIQSKNDNILTKKSHPTQSSSEELPAKLSVPTPAEDEQNSRQSKAAAHHSDAGPSVELEAATSKRRNGSGSIVSLYNGESKEQAGGRPSRSTRTTKSFKEPKLNCKMRR